MKNIKFQIFKNFDKDLKSAVFYDAANVLKKNNKAAFFTFIFLSIYILSKPFYLYYTGYLMRLKKIELLKQQGKYIL